MHLTLDNKFKKLVVIGDRVLPGVQEKEKVQQGYVIKTGPGYAIPMPVDDEPWKHQPQSAILMLEREEDI